MSGLAGPQPKTRTEVPGRARRLLRLADRYAGIPLVVCLAALRTRQKMPTRIERIGLLATAAIGDTILMGAAASDLRSAYPHASIVVFAGPSNYEAARLLDTPNRVEMIPIANLPVALRKLRQYQSDVLIDFGPWARLNALLALLANAKLTVGFRTPGQHRHLGYDIAVDHRNDVHELENHRALVRALGVAPSHLPFLNSATLRVTPFSTDEPFVVLHPWPGGALARLREWPLNRWIDLAAELAGMGLRIVLTGAPAQHALNNVIISNVPGPSRAMMRNAAGLSLAETATLLSRARLVVSVNTGVSHLAAALGIPQVVLHGPTSARRWGPVSDAAIAIESPLGGCGYLHLGFERQRQPPKCMEAITYRTVLDACHRVLAESPARVPPPRALDRPDSPRVRALAPR